MMSGSLYQNVQCNYIISIYIIIYQCCRVIYKSHHYSHMPVTGRAQSMVFLAFNVQLSLNKELYHDSPNSQSLKLERTFQFVQVFLPKNTHTPLNPRERSFSSPQMPPPGQVPRRKKYIPLSLEESLYPGPTQPVSSLTLGWWRSQTPPHSGCLPSGLMIFLSERVYAPSFRCRLTNTEHTGLLLPCMSDAFVFKKT